MQYVSDIYFDPNQLSDHNFTYRLILKYIFYNPILLFICESIIEDKSEE